MRPADLKNIFVFAFFPNFLLTLYLQGCICRGGHGSSTPLPKISDP